MSLKLRNKKRPLDHLLTLLCLFVCFFVIVYTLTGYGEFSKLVG